MLASRSPNALTSSAAVALAVAIAASCECGASDRDIDPDSVPIGGWYRAEIAAAGGDRVPFYLLLPADPEEASAKIRNGAQEFDASHHWEAASAGVEFPIYRTELRADAREDGELVGSFVNESLAFGDSELDFRAEPISEPDPDRRFRRGDGEAEGEDAGELPENWRLTFDDTGDAELSIAPGEGSAVEAALRLENGNAIYLAGNARGQSLQLSGFDGSAPYLLRAELAGDRLEGAWLAGPDLSWRESVTGAAEPDFEVRAEPSLRGRAPRLPIPELREPPYEDSPVIVALTGSWSPASVRALSFLRELYEDHRDEGLEILTLNYELTEDEAYNDDAAELLAEAHEVPWSIIPVDGRAEDYNAIVPAGLEDTDVQSFPLLAFVDRQGAVRALRAGFPPEAAAEMHEETVAEYRELAREIAGGAE